MNASTVNVTVTGAAGQIGYALLFRIAARPDARPRHAGRAEAARDPGRGEGRRGHGDGAGRLRVPAAGRRSTSTTTRRRRSTACNIALLVGARPRTKGMERADLLEANGGIFKPQGEAINADAADDVRVLVVGNPANTNALIAMSNAPDVPRERFTAMTRLDHNRAVAQLAEQDSACAVADITNMTVWGNHSPTHVPRPVQREGEGRARRPRRSTTRPGWRTTSSRRSASAARRSSRRAARRARRRRPTRRSTTCATGCSAPPTATGSRWPFPPTAPTASRRGSSPRSRDRARQASGRSSRGSTCTTSRRRGSTRRSTS